MVGELPSPFPGLATWGVGVDDHAFGGGHVQEAMGFGRLLLLNQAHAAIAGADRRS
jgi:hypothetical protein